jgi:hypothetical protein
VRHCGASFQLPLAIKRLAVRLVECLALTRMCLTCACAVWQQVATAKLSCTFPMPAIFMEYTADFESVHTCWQAS